MTEIYLSDMSVCAPEESLSYSPKKGCWRLIDYELEGLTGTMLWANSMTRAPAVTYPLNVKGWYAIYLGLWDWAWSSVPALVTEHWAEGGNELRVKLQNDSCFTRISKEFADFKVEEFFWRYADLTGERFVVGQQAEGFPARACLAYIKLVSLSSEQAEGLKKDWERKDTKRLVAMNDGYSWLYETHPRSREEIWSQVERYRHTDFGMLCYEYGYAGPQGLEVSNLEDFPRQGEEFANDSVRAFKANGIEPFREVVNYGHGLGLKVYASIRMGLTKMPPPWDDFTQASGRLFQRYSKFACVNADGSSASCLSYAYPEVRSHVVGAFRKALLLGADGINPLFHRGPPFVLYEEPLANGFKERYGEDPRSLPETDERWLKFRAVALINFMVELRKETDRSAEALSRDVPRVSCVVFPTRAENLRYGIDIELWVKEALVDSILVRDSLYASWEKDPVDVRFFRNLVKGTKCEFNVMLGNVASVYRGLGGTENIMETYTKRVSELYEAGVERIAFWDSALQERFVATWSAMRNLGHAQELGKPQETNAMVRSLGLKKLGGMDVSFRHDAWYFV